MVKFHLFQDNETSTNIVDLNLSSYSLESQEIQIESEIAPSIVDVSDLVTISGIVTFDGSPLQNADITISIPYTGEEYSSVSNITGSFSVTFIAPLLLDPTNTSYDIGSDGILIEAQDDVNKGYLLRSLTVTGLVITNVHATPEIQIQTNPVNISCQIYSVYPLLDVRVNISGPLNFSYQNLSMVHFNHSVYYLSQIYSIIGDYSYYIWGINENETSASSHLYTFIIISENVTIDVNQSMMDRGFPIRHALDGDWAAAQSFIPTKNYLTSVKIYLRKFGTPEFNLTVELREDHPQGTLLDTKMFTPEEVPNSWEWFEIDFEDTVVIPETEYFIVCPPAPSGVTTSFGYEWRYAFGNQYDDGAFWFTRDSGGLWRDLPTMYEFCFRTYGYN
jgi:hypothetical protein